MKRFSDIYVILIITFYVLVGFFVYSDYGISWDESFQHDYGKAVYEYVFHDSQDLLEHRSRYHGPIFQLALYGSEKVLGVTDIGNVFRLRHLLNFLFSAIGLIFFYRLLRELKFSQFWSAVGLLFLIGSPRIFAHSFYNSKDVVFMYGFIIATFTMLRFLRKPSWKTALWHSVACGLLIDVRILGFFVPIFTGVYWCFGLIQDRSRWIRSIAPASLFGVMTILVMTIFWPTLWHDPVTEFANAISRMSDYPWDDPILFEGKFQFPKELPWYYLPKWILISSPLFILLSASVGSVAWFWGHQRSPSEKLLPLLWLVLPIAVIIGKEATVYDGWRHVFFVYPAIVVLAICGAQFLFESIPSNKYVKWVAVVLVAFPITWIVRNHPNQQVYFNPVYRTKAWANYEMDYWGLGYYQAYQWLTIERKEGPLKLAVANAPGFYNHWLLPEADRNRISFVSRDSADFFLSNFRYPNEHQAATLSEGAYQSPLWVLKVDGNRVCGIFEPAR